MSIKKFRKPNWLKTDYDIALDQYREIKHQREKTLYALATCYEALATGVIHGKEEHSMLVRVKQLNGVLFNDSIRLARAEQKLNKSARSKF